jgi:hypothetical protein
LLHALALIAAAVATAALLVEVSLTLLVVSLAFRARKTPSRAGARESRKCRWSASLGKGTSSGATMIDRNRSFRGALGMVAALIAVVTNAMSAR